MLIGRIIAEGELSTKIMMFPSKICAAAVSGRSVYLNFGNGLYHFEVNRHSARLSTPLSVMAALILGEFSVKSGWFNAEVMHNAINPYKIKASKPPIRITHIDC